MTNIVLAICSHLHVILTHIQFLYWGANIHLCGCIQINSQGHFLKYTKHCFTFQTNPVTYLVMAHQCEKVNYYPYTICDLLDCRGLVITYNDPTKHCAFVWNNMQGIWKCQFLTIWAFREYVCNPEPLQQMDSSWKLIDDRWVNYIMSFEWVPTVSCIAGKITLLSLYSGWLEPADVGIRYYQRALLFIFIFTIQVACVNPLFFEVQNNIGRLLSL